MPTQKGSGMIVIQSIDHIEIKFNLVGLTPIILNRMSVKAMHEILCPKIKIRGTRDALKPKHDPVAEFLASPYIFTCKKKSVDPNRNQRMTDESHGSVFFADSQDAPTYLCHLSSAFKGALKGSAVDMPGAKKAQIGRLTWVPGERIPIYGIPKIFSSVVRSADMNRTPDIRTRVILPRWACQVVVEYVTPLLNAQSITNLFATAGITQGIGDWRPEKGSGTYGQFRIVTDDEDPEFNFILEHGGREAQMNAMESPEPYDQETEDLLAWFSEEARQRGFILSQGNGHDEEAQEENDDEIRSNEDSSEIEMVD